VSEIVEEHREPQGLPQAIALAIRQVELRQERLEDAGRHRHRAEAVCVARMGRPGKGEIREPELLHVA